MPSRPHDKLSDFLPALQPAHSSSSLHREWFAAPSRPAFESRSPAISAESKSWCGCRQNILPAVSGSAAANLYRPHTGPMGPGQNASRSDSRLLLPSADSLPANRSCIGRAFHQSSLFSTRIGFSFLPKGSLISVIVMEIRMMIPPTTICGDSGS